MNLYYYVGPVKEFGRIINDNWNAYTYAQSEKKARSNMAYQYKKKTRRSVRSKIELPGKIVQVYFAHIPDEAQLSFFDMNPEVFN